MKTNVEFKGFETKAGAGQREELRKLIDKLIARLEKKAKTLDPAAMSLRMVVEKISARKLYKVSATVDVPGRALAARQEQHDPTSVVRQVFAELDRQFDEHKVKVRGEHIWNRVTRRQEQRRKEVVGASLSELDHDAFFTLVSPHLSALHDFVKHVLEFAEARGDLTRDQLTHDDIVDEVLVRACDDFVNDRPPRDVRGWLVELAESDIQRGIKRAKWERHHTVPVESNIPETFPMDGVSTLGDEILDFYQPDEDLKLEDILPDLEVESPEEEAAREELRGCVREALNTMPRPWRRAVLAYHLEGLTGVELAESVARPQQEVERILEYARGYLRERLLEAGCFFDPSTAPAKTHA